MRPYPSQYITTWSLQDGTPVIVRPIRPEDEPLMIQFHQAISDRSVHFRYFHAIKLSHRVSHERLKQICFTDFDHEIVLVAECCEAVTGIPEIMGIGRLSRIDGSRGEFAILISDSWQHHGIGSELLRRLIEVGRYEGIRRIKGDILIENHDMQEVCRKCGFTVSDQIRDGAVRAEIHLNDPKAIEPVTET